MMGKSVIVGGMRRRAKTWASKTGRGSCRSILHICNGSYGMRGNRDPEVACPQERLARRKRERGWKRRATDQEFDSLLFHMVDAPSR